MRTPARPSASKALRHSALAIAVALALAPLGAGAVVVKNVTSTADSGADTLRAVLGEIAIDPNCAVEDYHINFNFAGTGPFVISPATDLPALQCRSVTLNTGEAAGIQIKRPVGFEGGSCVLRTQGATLAIVKKLSFLDYVNETVLCGKFHALGNTVSNASRGMSLTAGSIADRNVVNGDYGISITGEGQITGNTVSFTSWEGISGQSDGYGGPTIENNTVNGTLTDISYFGIIAYSSPSVSNNTVSDAYIGISVNGAGMQVIGNTVIDNSYGGIVADNGATVEGNFIGGSQTGIYSNAVTLRGNFVGTFGGRRPNGVGIYDESIDIGSIIENNYVSGNSTNGIYLDGYNGVVRGNLIGTSSTGTAALPNDGPGVFVGRAASDYEISNNTISGNNGAGIYVEADGASLSIWNNRIGTNSAGTAPLGNGSIGIDVPCSGFDISIKGNTISGNALHGIWLGGVFGDPTFGSVENNYIGTATGGSGLIPNGGNGVTLALAGPPAECYPILTKVLVTKSAIGKRQAALQAKLQRTAPSRATAKAPMPKAINSLATNFVPILGNTIKNNAGSGIEVRDDGQGNHWFANSIAGNRVKNIDLNGGAVLANDDGDVDMGNNLKQNFADIGAVSQTINNTTNVTFTLKTESPDPVNCATLTGGYLYRVDFFENGGPSVPAGDSPIGSGFAGNVVITGPACGGPITYTHSISGLRDYVSNTVRNESTESSSEFSAVVAAVPAPAVAINPAPPIDFGDVPMFATGTRAVTLTSVGGQPWRFSSFSTDSSCGRAAKAAVPACAAPFSCDTTCVSGTDVANGGSCTLTATFSPTTTGSASQALYLCDNAHVFGHPVNLVGNGLPAAVATVTPSTWNFGSVRVGQKSIFKSFSVLNENPVPSTISAITTGSPDFIRESTTCPIAPATLGSGQACEVVVSFAPSIPGPGSGTLRIASGGGGLSDATAALQGQGTQVAEITLPASLDFGTYTVGAAAITRSVTLTNTGNTDVMFSSVTAGAPFTVSSNGCGANLPPNASCTIVVSFAPTTTGTFSGSLAVSSNAQGSGSVALSGTAQAAPVPLATLSSGTLDLGAVPRGTTSAPGSITVTSNGTAPYVIGKYSADSSCSTAASVCASGEFLCSLGCNPGESYSPGASCTITARFAPLALGVRSTTFYICDNTAASPRAVTLKGEGTNPVVVEVGPSSHDFGVVPVGQASAPRTFTVVNSGGAAVSISAPFVSANYRIASHNCPTSLGPSQRCSVEVLFVPTIAGSIGGQLVIQATGAGQSSAFASLRGTGGTQPALDLPTAVDFGSVQTGTGTVTRNITVANAGNAPLALSSVTLVGTHYTLQNDCSGTVAAGASCVLRVTFAPTESGEFNGSLTVVANVSGGPRTVALTGRAQPRPVPLVRLSPANMGFGDRQIGSQSTPQRVTVSNVGGAPAAIERINLGPDYVIASNTCGSSVAAQQTCIIEVALRPVGFGPRADQLQLVTNSEGSPHTVNLSGTGCRPYTPGTRNNGRNSACAP